MFLPQSNYTQNGINCRIYSPVRDGMLVEIITQIQSSPVRDGIYIVPTALPKMCVFHYFYQYFVPTALFKARKCAVIYPIYSIRPNFPILILKQARKCWKQKMAAISTTILCSFRSRFSFGIITSKC